MNLKWRLRGTPRLTIWRKRQLRGPRVTFIIALFFRIFNVTKDLINTIIQKRLSREDTKLNCVCIIENGKINYYKRAGHSPKPTPWRVKGKRSPSSQLDSIIWAPSLCTMVTHILILSYAISAYQNYFLNATILIQDINKKKRLK